MYKTCADEDIQSHMTENGIYKVTVRMDPLLAIILEAFDKIEPIEEDENATKQRTT